jgi:hypothetical protein
MDEPNIQNLIQKIAETGADPAWVAELISEAQAAGAGRSAVIAAGLDPGPDPALQASPVRPRPQLRLVVGGLG